MRFGFTVLAGGLVAVSLACGGSGGNMPAPPSAPTPPPPSGTTCADVSGTWSAIWSMVCAGSGGASSVVVTQIGCTVTFTVAGLGMFSGALVGDRSSPNLTLTFANDAPGNGGNCPRVSEGGLTLTSPARISLPFGTGPPPCCQHGSVVMTR